MRALIAIDKFKGSLTATAVAKAIQQALLRADPSWQCDLCPIADGGEGTADAIVTALNGRWVTAEVLDPLGRPLNARYGIVKHAGESQAIVEMSAASGLALVNDLPADPLRASTFGTGELLRHAAAQGVQQILIGIGGSATNDGGLGMAQALGWEGLGANSEPIPDLPEKTECVISLRPPASMDLPPITVACDVTNPLLGPIGASAVYGPQKGVTDIPFFEKDLVAGSGILQELPVGTHRTVSELIELMITESDNIATNLLIDLLGVETINARIHSLGCSETILRRRMMDFAAAEAGRDNLTSARDVIRLLTRLYNANCVGAEADATMCSILERQTDRCKIPLLLPSDTICQHKTGELPGAEHDAGIVRTSKGTYLIAIMSDDLPDPEHGRQVIAQLSRIIYDWYDQTSFNS